MLNEVFNSAHQYWFIVKTYFQVEEAKKRSKRSKAIALADAKAKSWLKINNKANKDIQYSFT